jgi:hypothetical protein
MFPSSKANETLSEKVRVRVPRGPITVTVHPSI